MARLAGQQTPEVFFHGSGVCCPTQVFLCAGVLNIVPRVCTASSLPTEPSLWFLPDLFFKSNFCFTSFLCVCYILSTCMSLHHVRAWCPQRLERESDLLKLELQMFVSHRVGTGTPGPLEEQPMLFNCQAISPANVFNVQSVVP